MTTYQPQLPEHPPRVAMKAETISSFLIRGSLVVQNFLQEILTALAIGILKKFIRG